MGMDRIVTFAEEQAPSWESVMALLTQHNYPVQMRMINGELAFPDEEPPEDWREIRVGTPGGMVTVRRDPSRFVLVIWGNAESELLQAWNALAWALACASQGTVLEAEQSLTPEQGQQGAELPPVFSS